MERVHIVGIVACLCALSAAWKRTLPRSRQCTQTGHNTYYMDSLHEPVNTLARVWWWPPEDGSLYDPKHVGVKEFYVILMCFLINICMSWLLLTLILSMHGSTMKINLLYSLNWESAHHTALRHITIYTNIKMKRNMHSHIKQDSNPWSLCSEQDCET